MRWYEINPVAHDVLQQGSVSSATLWVFNGAISPDRVVNGTKHAFGADMVLTYDTTSKATATTAWVRSKTGAGAVSAPTKIAISNAPDTGP